jgi:hypothetical protein
VKVTVTSLRSETGAGAVPAAGRGAAATPVTPVAPPVIGAPQSPQNLLPGGFAAPQVVHADASGVPQSPQNRFSAGFSAPQLGQVIVRASVAHARPRA